MDSNFKDTATYVSPKGKEIIEFSSYPSDDKIANIDLLEIKNYIDAKEDQLKSFGFNSENCHFHGGCGIPLNKTYDLQKGDINYSLIINRNMNLFYLSGRVTKPSEFNEVLKIGCDILGPPKTIQYSKNGKFDDAYATWTSKNKLTKLWTKLHEGNFIYLDPLVDFPKKLS